MKYYIYIKNEATNGAGRARCLNEDITNLEVAEEVYNAFVDNPGMYVYSTESNSIVENPNYEAEQAAKERARLNLLSLTKADVLLALYKDKGITPDNIKTMLADNVPALIKLDYASSYYRGDEVVNALGLALGYTTEEMDYLFENKAFPEREEEEPAEEETEGETTETDSEEEVPEPAEGVEEENVNNGNDYSQNESENVNNEVEDEETPAEEEPAEEEPVEEEIQQEET